MMWKTENSTYAWNNLDRVEACLVLGPVSVSQTYPTPNHEMTPIKLLAGTGNDLSLREKGYVRNHIVIDIRATA